MTKTRTSAILGLLLGVVLGSTILSPAWGQLAPPSDAVRIEIFEDVPPGSEFELSGLTPVEEYSEAAMAIVRFPTKYSKNALPLDRSTVFVVRASTEAKFEPGEYQFRLRSKGAARFLVDDELVLTTRPQVPNSSGHDPVPPPLKQEMPELRPPPYPHQEEKNFVRLDGRPHRFTLIALIGGKGLVPSPGELSVSVARPGEIPRVLGSAGAPRLTDSEWQSFAQAQELKHRTGDVRRRMAASAEVRHSWEEYHRKVRERFEAVKGPKPPVVSGRAPVFNAIDQFIGARLEAAGLSPTELLSDLEFLRRLSLDTVGLIPTTDEIRQYLDWPVPERRKQAIEYYLAQPGWADHWVSYWQDVLAENPGILKPDLNNSGPFRWWLHQSFTDGIPFDRLVVELIEMEGSVYQGAPAAFKLATLNDAPTAAKADILAQAFLGERLSCARCHDAPNHPHKQKDTFSLAAMLEGKPVTLPVSSTVPFVEGFRKPRVEITLAPGEKIDPHWPFPSLVGTSDLADQIPVSPTAPRTRQDVARIIVSPDNERFSQVAVNRVWKRYLGAGLVEPPEDWQETKPSHPELLEYLAREFVSSGYDLKALARLIFSSHLYQRQPVSAGSASLTSDKRLFQGPQRRRMTAEQLVDSLFLCSGKEFNCEELNLNPAGNRPLREFLNLGTPRRAWEFTALMNERDRPALALPLAQSIVDVLTAFGWRQSRQNPLTVREEAPSPMQTLLLANGVMGTRVVRLSDDSAFTELALQSRSAGELVRETFLRIVTRLPSESEQRAAEDLLESHFSNRVVPGAMKRSRRLAGDTRVSWGNHLSSEATVIRMEEERRLRMGDDPTERLSAAFRERYEDLIWSLMNSPEFILVP